MKNKKWIIGEYDKNTVDSLSRALSISPLCSKLLIKRGYSTEESAKVFLNKAITGFHSPFLMKDMEKAVEIIKNAYEKHYKILIWGDYDVDGVTSVTILLKYFLSKGFDAEYYIPRRLDEGYGLNRTSIKDFADRSGKLLITVDCGITADNEIEYAKSLGVEVIVTDHHECRDSLPRAEAIINPKRHDCPYPFKNLAGVGVAFKLICACEMVFNNISHMECLEHVLKEYSDLTSIGTIADVMPISDENRLIVDQGLASISNTDNLGLEALIDDAGIYAKSYKKKKISSTTIGFILAPKINAAGRIGTSRTAVDLFLTKSREEAANLAKTLSNINKERQALENIILNEAIAKIEAEIDFENDKIIILCDDSWHHGVIGIVASRITEKYNLPTILISYRNEGHEKSENLGKGSGRSIKGMNIVDSLKKCSDILIKFGGHELAAGLSIDKINFDSFKKRMNEYAKEAFSKTDAQKFLEPDCEVLTSDISIESVNEISLLEPFGLSNPVPVFCAKNMLLHSLSSIGDDKHSKLVLKKDGRYLVALFFGRTPGSLSVMEGDYIDVVFNMDVNNFKNQLSVQMIIRDIRPCESVIKKNEAGFLRYNEIKYGSNGVVFFREIPTRDDFRAVYSLLQAYASVSKNDYFDIDIPFLSRLANKKFGVDLTICKAFIIIDVFTEAGLVEFASGQTSEYTKSVSKNSIIKSSQIKKELTLTRTMQDIISRMIN